MLRDYQQAAVDAAQTWIKYQSQPGIIQMPTGSGKTHVIKALAEWCVSLGQRVLVLAHRKELLEQAHTKFDHNNVTFYSASVGQKDLSGDIVLAGVQSLSRRDDITGFDVVLVDECHLIPNKVTDEGWYWKILSQLPDAKIIGLTATPYRTASGPLAWGEIIYEIGYDYLWNKGYLTPIKNKLLNGFAPDWADLDVKLGDFVLSQLEEGVCEPELIEAAVRTIKQQCYYQNSVLIFCVTVQHCQMLKDTMEHSGIDRIGMVTGEMNHTQRDQTIEDFKAGKLKYLINCEILTIGFDAPIVDTIVCLRPTKSKVLWEQICGRGVRLDERKEDCLLLDMAGNLAEHGPLGTKYKGKATKGEPDESQGKICPECETFVNPTAKECEDCGFVFPEPEQRSFTHNTKPDDGDYSKPNPYLTKKVDGIGFTRHVSRNSGKTSLRVDYFLDGYGYGKISEWLVPLHENEWARTKGRQALKDLGVEMIWVEGAEIDYDRLAAMCDMSAKAPDKIVIDDSEKHPKVVQRIYEQELDLDDEIPY